MAEFEPPFKKEPKSKPSRRSRISRNHRISRTSTPKEAFVKNRRANGVATRQRIIETARGMFATGGYEATSLRQIAGASTIDIATLKYHFGDKSSLFAEVYRHGHEALMLYLKPCLDGLKEVDGPDSLRVALEDLVIGLHDFISTEFSFVRMFLFRLLEGADAIITLEDALQGVAMEMFDDVFENLRQLKLIRDVDHRAVLNLLVSSFTTWFLIAEVKPTWIQAPSPMHEEGRYRSEAFFVDMLERLLLD